MLVAALASLWALTSSAPSTSITFISLLVFLPVAVLVVFVLNAAKQRLKELNGANAALKQRTEELERRTIEQKQTKSALRASEERYRTMIEWSPDAILVHRAGKILYVNPAAVRLFGAPDAPNLMQKSTAELIHPDSQSEQAARMKSILRNETIAPMVDAKFFKLDGTVIDVEVQGTAIDYDGAPAIHVSIRDITQRKQMENQIRQLAFYDELTQLPNRRLLNDRLGQAITDNRRNHCCGAVLFLDLDNFKPLNDRHGHTVGDLLLMEVAKRLKSCVRAMDTVARFGGDEFVVVLKQLDTGRELSELQAHGVAEKIRASLSEPYDIAVNAALNGTLHITHHCTASTGVVVFCGEDDQTDDLIKWADAAMYQAKEDGRSKIRVARVSTPDQEEVISYQDSGFFEGAFPALD